MRHFFEPQATAFGEDNAGNARPVVLFVQLRQNTARVGQAEFLERAIGQHASPAVKNHHGLGAGFDLGVEVERHRVGIDLQHLVHQVRAAVHHGFHQTVVVRTRTFDHVAGQRPGTAAETDQWYLAIERFADRCDGIKYVAQLGHVRHLQFGHSGFIAHGECKFGALTQGK
ncbi:MAG: hypothetical protein ACD_23C00144G0004 [uncultured bacterium]|nr:MAG: hypothetical protein ACD_23C00144G0004 [uncultured bacterium]